MKENMKFYYNDYQYRKYVLEKIINIIDKQEQTQANQILFFGDSLVEGIPNTCNIINNGIGGITSQALLNNLDELVIKFKPKAVYLHVGANDLNETSMTSPRDVAQNVLKIFSILKGNLPNTTMHLISTLPCIDSEDVIYSSGRGIRRNFMHDILNEEYKRYLIPEGIEYIDLNRFLFNEKKEPCKAYFTDGLHLTETTYEYLIEKFKEYYY